MTQDERDLLLALASVAERLIDPAKDDALRKRVMLLARRVRTVAGAGR